MASPFTNGPVITLLTADSPFNNLIESARLQSVIVTAAANATTLVLYADTVTTNAPKEILSVTAPANTTVYVAFPLYDQTPFTVTTKKGLSATLTGAGGKAYIYLS